MKGGLGRIEGGRGENLVSIFSDELEQKLRDALSRIERLENAQTAERCVSQWQYLVERPHPWRRQLCVKGRNMTAAQLVGAMKANSLTATAAADDFDLPITAIDEAVRYCAAEAELLALEADEERRRLIERGYRLEPSPLS
jgi:uncharacterized protein (DUF433 family)